MPDLFLPEDIRPTKWPGYYAGKDGTIYRTMRKIDDWLVKKFNLEIRHGLIVMRTFNRGIPDPKYAHTRYPSINLYCVKDGERINRREYVHRLVAEAWIPNPNNYETVDHLDRNKHNNSVDNLRWCTLEENQKSWQR